MSQEDSPGQPRLTQSALWGAAQGWLMHDPTRISYATGTLLANFSHSPEAALVLCTDTVVSQLALLASVDGQSPAGCAFRCQVLLKDSLTPMSRFVLACAATCLVLHEVPPPSGARPVAGVMHSFSRLRAGGALDLAMSESGLVAQPGLPLASEILVHTPPVLAALAWLQAEEDVSAACELLERQQLFLLKG